jgi:hypothetical protein
LENWKLVVLAVVVALVTLVVVASRLQRGRHRPLAPRFDPTSHRPELGMEATDLASVQGILGRNAALARKTGAGAGQASWTEVGAASPPKNSQDHRP